MPLHEHRTRRVGERTGAQQGGGTGLVVDIWEAHARIPRQPVLQREQRMPVCSGYYFWVMRPPTFSSLRQLFYECEQGMLDRLLSA